MLGLGLGITGVRGLWSPARLFSGGEQGIFIDPSDLTTMFQDRDGTTPVTAPGQSVGYVLDKSGRGFHMTAVSDAARGTYNVDENGKAFILFDGADDGYATSTITPGTDKVQVFAGVRKLADVGIGMVAELGTSFSSMGGFYLATEYTRYGFAPRGNRQSLSNDQVNVTGFFAPDTAVLTAKVDLNAGTPAQLRRNAGVFQNSPHTSFGGGNFLAYPLYIGRRAGHSLPFNGRIYGLIVRFGANLTAGQIAATEAWVNSKTGAY